MTDALYFRGKARLAALQIIDHTSLSTTQLDVGDDGELLTVAPPVEVLDRMSSGELILYDALRSIAGRDRLSLFELVHGVDHQTAWCVWWAFGVLIDTVIPMPHVDFDGLTDAVRRRPR